MLTGLAIGSTETQQIRLAGLSPGALDPYFASVSALIKMVPSGGPLPFVDSSTNSRVVDQAGTPALYPVISSDPGKFYSTSGYFPGGYLHLDDTDGKLTMAGDFTIGMWVKRIDDLWAGIIGSNGGGGNVQFTINGGASGPSEGQVGAYLNGAAAVSASGVLPINSWEFVSFTRSGSVIWCHVGGVMVFSVPYAGLVQFNYVGFTIYRSPFSGYLGEVEITKDVARYNGDNYLPPTSPFFDGTSILQLKQGSQLILPPSLAAG